MKWDGVPLGARFSLATNRLNFCGPSDAEPRLYRAAARGDGLEAAADSLSRFEALYPYLEAIGRRHGLEPFDAQVVEAYWVGNALLDPFGRPEFDAILSALTARGLPAFVADELRERLPPRPLPHHAFHVAFVGVGAVTGHVPTNLENMERCRPSWGTVVGVEPDRVRLRGPALASTGRSLELGPALERTVRYEPELIPRLAPGETVAAHWGWAAARLAPDQARALARYTERSLEQANWAGNLRGDAA